MAKKDFNTLYSDLAYRIYADDMQSQRYYLSMIEDQRKISVDYLLERGCIFVPNNDYIRHYLGADANTYGAELYIDERCLWTLYVLVPIMDLSGEVIGIIGWDAQSKYLEITEGAEGLSMYKTSSKNVFKKDKFFLSDINLLKKRFQERSIFVVDGVFDSISLNYHGLPAISLLGSTFSREVLYFLRWYDAVYVISDNDAAGTKLHKMLNRSLDNVYRVSQSKAKDIEEILREDTDGYVVSQLNSVLLDKPHLSVNIKV